MTHSLTPPNKNKSFLQIPQNNTLLNVSNKIFQHGLYLLNLGKTQLAKDSFEEVLKIDKKHFDAIHLLGIISVQQKDLKSAIQFFRKALKLNPLNIYCYCNLGNAYLESVELESALLNYNKAIEIQPDYAEAYCFKAIALTTLQRFEESIKNLKIAINFKADFAEAYVNLGDVYNKIKQFEMALSNYDKAISIKSDFALAFSNRGITLKELNRNDEALASFQKAIDIQPNYAEAYFNLGNTFSQLNRKDEALVNFNQAVFYKSDYAEAYWNKATVLLELSDFEAGWPLYSWRWQNKELNLKKISTNKPQVIDHLSICNKKILVWGEQGVGDQVLYAGMLDQLLVIASTVHLKLDPRITPLLYRVVPTAIFHDDKKNIKEIDFDMHMPLADLGKFFRMDSNSFVRDRKYYIRADPIKAIEIRESLLKNKKFLCGITWNSKREDIGSEKSVKLIDLLPILSIDNISFVSLQYGDVKQQISELNTSHDLNIQEYDSIDNFNNLDGHAALIEACDFVVSISNTSAHISGALGKETYLMCPIGKGALWYWSNEFNGKSMWYPSVKIIRQTTSGKWIDVIEKITSIIQKKFNN